MHLSLKKSRVIVDPGPLQDKPQFLARAPASVVFLLIVDVAPDLVHVGRTYRAGGIAFLPGKGLQRHIRMNP